MFIWEISVKEVTMLMKDVPSQRMNRFMISLESRLVSLMILLTLLPLSLMADAELLSPPDQLSVGPLLDNPLGYGENLPQFSWQLPVQEKGIRQSAYQIVCAHSVSGLETRLYLWDSGWVDSEQSIFVDYEGPPLASRDLVFWKVRFRSASGVGSEWSEVSRFEMALLEYSDWQASWIFRPTEKPEESSPSPYLRKQFELDKKEVATARIYIASRGMFELEVNGSKIGDDYFQSEWTDYTKRSLYVTYDVTGHILSGANAIGAILGESWYAGKLGYSVQRNQYGEIPELLLQLEVTFEDGSRQIVVSDETWRATTGPITFTNIYDGERYDARLELGAWSTANFDDADWENVTQKALNPSVLLVARPHQPVRITRELRPRSMTEIAPGSFIFDLGQNMVGWARIKVPGVPDHTYTLRFAEMLQKDGTLYTANYRAADSIDTYTCRGDREEKWEPRFSFHGFRYVELSGLLPGVEPDLSWVTGVVLHNDMPETGSFSSSHAMLNQLQSNIQWSQRGNFLALPTDCPQRDERLGWTGDAQVFCATANFNFDTLAFFVKWSADLRDSQRPDGSIPDYVPEFPRGKKTSSSAWGDAAVIVPWEVYQSFGYIRILEDNYEMMCDWVRHYQEHPETKDLIHRGITYGDWLQPYRQEENERRGDTDFGLIGTAYFARCTDLVSRTADILGKNSDAEKYRKLFEDIRRAFQASFFDGAGRQTTEFETQTGYLLALGFDLLPKDRQVPVVAHLKALIVVVADGHLRTGFLGTPLIAPVLSKHGEIALAYDILFRTSYPGWFYSIEQGATTMWERWNSYSREDGFGSAGMNSFNHYAYGAIGEWLYETVAGLSAVEPGYKVIRFSPRPGGPLTHAELYLDTPYGIARSRWERVEDSMRYEIVVPPNTRGEFFIEGEALRVLAPGEYRFSKRKGELLRESME